MNAARKSHSRAASATCAGPAIPDERERRPPARHRRDIDGPALRRAVPPTPFPAPATASIPLRPAIPQGSARHSYF
jgi:hypothetical protein